MGGGLQNTPFLFIHVSSYLTLYILTMNSLDSSVLCPVSDASNVRGCNFVSAEPDLDIVQHRLGGVHTHDADFSLWSFQKNRMHPESKLIIGPGKCRELPTFPPNFLVYRLPSTTSSARRERCPTALRKGSKSCFCRTGGSHGTTSVRLCARHRLPGWERET